MTQSTFGIIGLGTMGRNLALNIESHGFPVAVWNLETEWTDAFLRDHAQQKFAGTRSLQELIGALERPRRLMMMIPAGAPVDQMIGQLTPLLERGDILVDGGNSYFEDTRRREAAMRGNGLDFVGCGVSGGEEGARFGPSLMPGGSDHAWERLRAVLEAIAAKTEAGPCVTHVGSDGAGHFVKMVHNGIEYGDMQLIAEVYDVLHRGLGLSTPEVGAIFDGWNRGPLESFLVELTAHVCRVMDPETNQPLVDVILDKAGQKGTGRWTAQVALELGVSIPTIGAALDGRVLSSMKDERVAAAARFGAADTKAPFASQDRARVISDLRDALHAARICSYAQGMALIAAGAAQYKWTIDLSEIGRIWKGGCIIRAKLLDPVRQAFKKKPDLINLLMDATVGAEAQRAQQGWRRAVSAAALAGIPVPALGASLAYFDSYHTARLPQNLTQAQRDAFGAHKFERVERPGFIHADWGMTQGS
ncbi:MAG: phosphogluconate dehydrogenase (NADP(+)-dependent, decarboxylating) [Acidobacteria bacterium]|nr:MAG: phosphogluconate dehydrogenase (NADP(+)-dependent, decarboxylating) [Acidobacteriota bacterium]